MRTFREIEEKSGSSPVRADHPSYDGAGTLILNGPKSSAVLQSSKELTDEDEDGWFDLRLLGANGRPILLHNALFTRSISHGFSGDNLEAHIFPNAVVLGANVLGEGNTVTSVSFRLKKLRFFFNYQKIEWQSLYRAKPEQIASLKKFRNKDRSYDVFKPKEIFVVHTLPRVLNFKVADRTYEIFIGSQSQSLGWSEIDYQTIPIATIKFKTPVSIDDALDAVWAWKRFFCQVAMASLPIEALSARGSKRREDRDWADAEIYLPNLDNRAEEKQTPFSMWRGNVPLNRWHQRKALSQVMQAWLAKEDERRRFRSALDVVLERSGERVSLDDVMALCSGIESLTDLNEEAEVGDDQIKLLAEGAIAAAKANAIEVDDNRIRGVIDLLRHQSLPKRLKLLFSKLPISADQASTLRKAVLDARRMAAHGASASTDAMPKISPTIDALACACALYDLTSCGMPLRSASNVPISSHNHMLWAIGELEQFKVKKNSG